MKARYYPMRWMRKLLGWCSGISCRELGRRTGLEHRTIRNLLAGHGTMHSLDTLMKKGLGRPVDQAFDD